MGEKREKTRKNERIMCWGGGCGMKQGTDKIDETRGEGKEERKRDLHA